MRKTLAVVAGLGLSASLGAFIGSFLGLTFDKLGKWPLLLTGGICLLYVPLVVIEQPAIKANVFFWPEFERGKPRWLVPGIKVAFFLFVIIFALFLILSHAASPDIQNGQYVLNNHGEIIRVLSQGEYLYLKEWELRMFASGWMCFYLPITAYWWFPRNRRLIL